MKIVHITTLDKSGAGNAAYRIVCALNGIGLDATLLCLHHRSENHKNIECYPVPKNTLWHRFLQKINLWKPDYERIHDMLKAYSVIDGISIWFSDLKLHKESIIKRSNIIHLHWFTQFLDLKTFLDKTKQPIVWTLHDMGAITGICSYSYMDCQKYCEQCGCCPALNSLQDTDLSKKMWKWKFNLYSKHKKRLYIVTPSQWLADCVRKSSLMSNENVRVIPNCIDTEIYRPVIHQHNSKELRFLLGAMDAKDPFKGYRRLISIIKKYQSKHHETHLVVQIVGHNSEKIEIDGVEIQSLGFIEKESSLVTIYNQADLLLYGSYRDNLPNMIMEAMSCGLPVVAFPIGGVPEMVIHKKTGYCAETEDDYVNGIQWCMAHRKQLSINAREKVEKDYSPQIIAQKYKLLYDEIKNKENQEI